MRTARDHVGKFALDTAHRGVVEAIVHFVWIVDEVVQFAGPAFQFECELVSPGSHGTQPKVDAAARCTKIPFGARKVPGGIAFNKRPQALAVDVPRQCGTSVVTERLRKVECRDRIRYHLACRHAGAFEQEPHAKQSFIGHRPLEQKSVIAKPVTVIGRVHDKRIAFEAHVADRQPDAAYLVIDERNHPVVIGDQRAQLRVRLSWRAGEPLAKAAQLLVAHLRHAIERGAMPPRTTLDLERRPWWHRAALEGVPQMSNEELRGFRERFSRTPGQTDAQLRALIANYYGMIALIDHQVGRIRLAIRDMGLEGNTLLVYSTDHGDWLGDHGLLLKGPMAYEGLLRVGLLFEGPGVPAGKVVPDPVSTLDLAQTFCDYAGTVLPAHVHSMSLRPLVEGNATRDFARSEWDLRASRCGVDLRLRTVRSRRHKLTVELESGAGELYDLSDDPEEMHNRFNDPAMRGVQRELADMIASRPQDASPLLPQIGMA